MSKAKAPGITLANYTLGNNITADNFVSFTYDGSNLLPKYTITSDEIMYIKGSLPGDLPGSARIGLETSAYVFFGSDVDGSWFTGSVTPDDQGGAGTWSVASSTPVPEPACLALLGIGLAGLGVTSRRKAA
ncbi:PEP-CTERM sorting domain-containing protein [Telmatospirillum sp.]|uniref:PEP-CTERM sorting domain-containing protein n=1 Tax=Telmatospirillum sp. TaxID=2079197 RepID=UPI002846E02A|nr:PEP-CTERM sorting domain-containing protein [Telmatospirillum sp.]MDR3439438.1 PEP-CTERM sorting domain-containing protein [Telmatospirillum sp.]